MTPERHRDTLEEAGTIGAAALRRARRLAWGVTALFGVLLGSLLAGFVTWESYFRVETGVHAVLGQLTHLLQIGDTFQLKSQLLSLAESGVIDRYTLHGANGLAIAGDGRQEIAGDERETTVAGTVDFRRIDGRLFVRRTFALGTLPNTAVLEVSKEIRFEYLLALLALLVAVFVIAQRTMQGALAAFARELTDPIARLSERMTNADSAAGLASDPAVAASLRYRELRDAWEAFAALLVRLGHEEALRHAAEKDAALAAIASQVAHDIRSPLTAMNVVLFSLEGVSEEERGILREASRRIQDIANDLLARTRCKTVDESAEAVSPSLVLRSLLREKRTQFRDHRGLTFVEALPPTDVPSIGLAHSELERVLSNLVNNAVESGGDPSAPLTVRVAAGTAAGKVWFEVEDDGPGIPRDVLSRLGREPVSAGKGGDAGHGLGLSHAHRVVENAGGSLHIASAEGAGTRVRIELPIEAKP